MSARFLILCFFIDLIVYVASEASIKSSIAAVIVTQPGEWHEVNTRRLKESLRIGILENLIFDTVSDFGDIRGGWAVWPLFKRLYNHVGGNTSQVSWVFFCEDGTGVKVENLHDLLQKYDPTKPLFLGRALRDQTPTIIHHFAFLGEDVAKFAFPDLAAGMAISWPLMEIIVQRLEGGQKPRDFTIDAKHELTMLVWDDGAGVELTDVPELCIKPVTNACVTEYVYGDYQQCPIYARTPITDEDVIFAVKTCHQFHKTRIVVVKRTWGLQARNIEYFSDHEDHYIPAINLGVENTEKGHCQKTLAILKHYVTNHGDKAKWLVIADDDTLLSVPSLLQLLNCYDPTLPLIIGERYGYGFHSDGSYGYSYPTGGAGMIFTTPAALKLVEECKCPTDDSPDDMILGIYAQNLGIEIIHSAALHQARPMDYASGYLERVKPISFHKHWEVDPYAVYSEWLAEPNKANQATAPDHSEL